MHPTPISSLPLSGYLAAFSDLLRQVATTDQRGCLAASDTAASQVVDWLVETRTARTKVFVVGNGGSAAIASHLHNDLTKAVGLRTLVFNDQPLLTALANDEGYDRVFERPIALWAEPGDMLIAISSSGNSDNIVNGAVTARQHGARVVTLSGFGPTNTLRSLGDINFYVPSGHYGLVEQAHSVLTHHLSDAAAAAVGSRITCRMQDDVAALAA